MHSHSILNNASQLCFIGLNLILLLSTIPAIYKIIHQYVTTDDCDKPKVLHFISGLVFSISTLLALLAITIMSMLEVHYTENHTTIHVCWIVFAICYALQSYFLLLLLFYRLYYIFLGSIYHISLKIVKLFKIVFICTPIILIFIPCLHYIRGTMTWSIIVAFLCILMLISMITLIFLFLFKLYNVLQKSSNDMELTSLMTKATILGTAAILATAISATLIITRYTIFIDNKYYIIQIICQWFGSLNIYINFICIILSYSSFKTYYNTLCGCIHSKCRDIILFFVFRNIQTKRLSKSVMITTHRKLHIHPHSMPARYEPTEVNAAYSTTNRPSVIVINSSPVNLVNFDVMSPTFDTITMSPRTPRTPRECIQRVPTISRSTLHDTNNLRFKRIESGSSGSITPTADDMDVTDRKLNIKDLQLELEDILEEENVHDDKNIGNNISQNTMKILKDHASASKLKDVMDNVSDNADDDYVNLNQAE
eukprot:355440_1